MTTFGRYDSELEMFIEEPHDPTPERLGFQRWLVEHDRLEHAPSGPSSGQYAEEKELAHA